MRHGKCFTFGPWDLEPEEYKVTFHYSVSFADAETLHFTESVLLRGISADAWDSAPAPLLTSLLRDLSLALGVTYWKLHCSPEICISSVPLSEAQAHFWNDVYTKGLAEFYYRAKIDFRGLVSFPYQKVSLAPSRLKIRDGARTLLLLGGGKDSIVAAELLREAEVPFDIFTIGLNRTQQRVSAIVATPRYTVYRIRDPQLKDIMRDERIPRGAPSGCWIIFLASLYAALNGYRYIAIGNESSADLGNLTYLDLNVNHQWSKSSEFERLVQEYITQSISPDITPYSPIRSISEIESTRRFSSYPEYFTAFSSCNMHIRLPREVTEATRPNRAFWCNTCTKCIFIFTCLAAFVPKDVVIDIFGKNLHADESLIPRYRRLLGLASFKPFECVGSPEEMIVALHRAYQSGAYTNDAALTLFENEILPTHPDIQTMENTVLSSEPLALPHR